MTLDLAIVQVRIKLLSLVYPILYILYEILSAYRMNQSKDIKDMNI